MMQDLEKMTPEAAYWHAVNVIKGRWPEAEEIIKTDSYFFNEYCKNVLKCDLIY